MTRDQLADEVGAEVKAAGRAVLGQLADDAGADGMLSMVAEVARGAVMAGRVELLDGLRDVLPWIGTYHKVTAARAVFGALFAVAGSVVRAGLAGLATVADE